VGGRREFKIGGATEHMQVQSIGRAIAAGVAKKAQLRVNILRVRLPVCMGGLCCCGGPNSTGTPALHGL